MKPWETDDQFLARWMNNELTSEELQAFEASEDFTAYKTILEVSDTLEAPGFDEEASLKKVQERIASTKTSSGKVISLNSYFKYAAAACAVLVIGISLYFGVLRESEFELTAKFKQELSLPDGSQVTVNQGSAISYLPGNWDNERVLQLEGEAFFEVEKGERFAVELPNGTVTVLGTSFNITSKEESLTVTCYTGKVKVEAFGQEQILLPGEMFVGGKNTPATKQNTQLKAPIWVSNLVQLENVPLTEALEYLGALYAIKIEGNINTELQFNGAFPSDDIEVAIQQIFGPFGIQYEWKPHLQTLTIE